MSFLPQVSASLVFALNLERRTPCRPLALLIGARFAGSPWARLAVSVMTLERRS
jgi:hypothetical protein